jgi:hypothetical protein
MPAVQYCVFVVVDKEFGTRISELLKRGPVWIVDTPTNRAAAQIIWTARSDQNLLDGVTVFKLFDCCSIEDTLVNELDIIDLHHGSHSADPPYTMLEIVGIQVTERIKSELSRFGFNKFEKTTTGFCAVRPLP